MQQFGVSFGEAVGQRLEHDGVVVVVLFFEFGHARINADAGGDSERADVVGHAGFLGGDVIS